MPNAQTHLAAACDLLASPAVQRALTWLGSGEARSAFLLGTISPDVRAISGHSREATHFFEIPPREGHMAHDLMFGRWPSLKHVTSMEPVRAAFVAGYVTHLIMDQVWVERIVMPYLFIDGVMWSTGHPNWRLYSILMSYMEYQAAERLPGGTVGLVERATPQGEWLPFVKDHYLVEWRDRVTGLIRRGGARVISRMFAQTNHMSSEALEAIVLSEERMAAEAYPVVSHKQLQAFRDEAARLSADAVLAYLSDVQGE